MILWEGILNGLSGIWTIARVVVPLMIVLEIARENKILDNINHIISRPFKHLGLTEHGAFPVVVAMIFGLTFGSGVILANIREGKLSSQEITIVGTFMAICHALVEDTLIFMVIGVPLWALLFPRTVMAIIASYIVYRVLEWKAQVRLDKGQVSNM